MIINATKKDASEKIVKIVNELKQIAHNAQKNKPCELLKTGMVGGPSTIFCRYAEVGESQIRSHIYPDAKICKSIDGWEANSLCLYCSG